MNNKKTCAQHGICDNFKIWFAAGATQTKF